MELVLLLLAFVSIVAVPIHAVNQTITADSSNCLYGTYSYFMAEYDVSYVQTFGASDLLHAGDECKYTFETSSSRDLCFTVEQFDSLCMVNIEFESGPVYAFPDKEISCYENSESSSSMSWCATYGNEAQIRFLHKATSTGGGGINVRVKVYTKSNEFNSVVESFANAAVTSIYVILGVIVAVVVLVIVLIIVVICCCCKRRTNSGGTVYRSPQQAQPVTQATYQVQSGGVVTNPGPGYQGPPPAGYQAPPAGYQAPPAGYQVPSAGYQAPPAGFQAPPAGYQAPPPAGYQGPPPPYQPSPAGFQPPPSQGYDGVKPSAPPM